MEEEIWKGIENYPNYEVSNLGRVRSITSGKLIHLQQRKNGYVKVSLWKNGKEKTIDVHLLVGHAFVDGYAPGKEINHEDGVKSNNRADNLTWTTRIENMEHAMRTGLFAPKPPEPHRRPVRIIETGEVFRSLTDCAKAIESSPVNIMYAISDEHPDHHSVKGLHFEFVSDEKIKKEPFLRPYQMEAVKKLRNGSILNGGVGSGKSRTGLYYYFSQCGGSINPDYKPMTHPKDLYILTTARKRDLMEFEGEMTPFHLSTNPDVCQYSIKVVVDSWNNIKKYKDIHGAFFLFDEDKVTGSGAWVKAFLNIARKNEWIILSATSGDTWMDYCAVFVANGFYKNKTEFIREHVAYSRFTKYPKIDRYLNTGKLIRLRDSILVPMDFKRQTVSHHEDIYVKYDIDKYKAAGKNRWDPFKNEPIRDASGLCYVWRRIVNEDESRQVALLELFEKHPKMIIFYNFNYELDILKEVFGGLKAVEIAEWNGHKHQPIPKSKSWVYLVQYTAGAEGWNCITTDTIVFFSQNYSYKIMQQSAGRIDRLNTPFTDLYYYHLKSRSGIDLAISRALHEKRNFNERKYVEGR